MSLSSPPLRGFPDYQRLVNRDSGPVYDYSPVLGNATIDLGVQDCSRYGYLGGQITDVVSSHLIQFTWYADVAHTKIIGIRELVISKNMGGGAFLRLVNLGPFVQVKLFPLGVANFKAQGVLFFTDRYHPLEFIPTTPTLINIANDPIGAGATNTYNPGDYYAGPVRIAMFASITPSQFAVQRVDSTGALNPVDVTAPVVSTWTVITTVVPAGAWQMLVTNQSAGAGSVHVHVTPSMTGSI